MRISLMRVEGFRSVVEPLELPFDPRVTVLLGANDHGKTNILAAIQTLNQDHATETRDLSWSRSSQVTELPSIEFRLTLSPEDRAAIKSALDEDYQSRLISEGQAGVAPPSVVPSEVVVRRTGVGGGLEVISDPLDVAVVKAVTTRLPKVELVEADAPIRDAISVSELVDPNSAPGAFMRGIFHFAEIDEDEWDAQLFSQDARSQARLEEASRTLNDRLRREWAQGRELSFRLRHDSATSSIGLFIDDPAVKGRWVLASERSAGFTHFFTLKTLLHGRARASGAESFVWLFDEPGTNLHPAGQFDLMRAFEAEAQSNQIIYTTHSLFLLNRNHPLRHRLVLKGTSGTQLDVKPYSGRWSRAFDALGLTAGAPFLFADAVLLSEGDSEPILLNAIFAKLAEADIVDKDLNPLAIIGTGDDVHAQYVLRMLRRDDGSPQVGLLFDGDKGGDSRLRRIQWPADQLGAKCIQLSKGTTIEDHVLFPRMLAQAAGEYAALLLALDEADAHRRLEDLLNRYDSRFGAKATTGLSAWIALECSRLFPELEGPPSKVGIARQYAQLLAGVDPHTVGRADSRRPRDLFARISDALSLPLPIARPDAILED